MSSVTIAKEEVILLVTAEVPEGQDLTTEATETDEETAETDTTVQEEADPEIDMTEEIEADTIDREIDQLIQDLIEITDVEIGTKDGQEEEILEKIEEEIMIEDIETDQIHQENPTAPMLIDNDLNHQFMKESEAIQAEIEDLTTKKKTLLRSISTLKMGTMKLTLADQINLTEVLMMVEMNEILKWN